MGCTKGFSFGILRIQRLVPWCLVTLPMAEKWKVAGSAQKEGSLAKGSSPWTISSSGSVGRPSSGFGRQGATSVVCLFQAPVGQSVSGCGIKKFIPTSLIPGNLPLQIKASLSARFVVSRRSFPTALIHLGQSAFEGCFSPPRRRCPGSSRRRAWRRCARRVPRRVPWVPCYDRFSSIYLRICFIFSCWFQRDSISLLEIGVILFPGV